MIKLKHLTVAVGLAILAGQASAAIRQPGDASGNGSELFAVIYDTESKASFMKDLGLQLQNFLPTVAGTGVTTAGTVIPFNITADSNWGSFLALTDGSPTLRFLVAAADSSGGATAGAQRFMATGGATNPFQSLSNLQVSSNLAAAPVKLLGDNQNRGTHSSASPVADNGSSVTTDDLAINFGKAGTLSPTWAAGLPVGNITGALGESLNFYFVARSAVGGNGGPPTRDQFDNVHGAAKWTF
ncbi:MAG: hypothetical protein ACKVQQ_22235, partial [Burkholderiales bacterium]